MIGGRHVCMSADDNADASVDIMAEGHLLRRRLGVEIDDHRIATITQRAHFELAVDGAERIVELRLDHHPAHDVHHQYALAVAASEDAHSLARHTRRIIQWAEHIGHALDEDKSFALVEGMIAERHHIGAGIDKPQIDLLGDAKTVRGILAVDDDEIGGVALLQLRQDARHRLTAGPADDIAEKQKAHVAISASVR